MYNSTAKSKTRNNNHIPTKQEAFSASLKAIFLNKKVHLFSSFNSIKGTCVDIINGNEFCLADAEYKIFSSTTPEILIEEKVQYIIIPRSGKAIALLEE